MKSEYKRDMNHNYLILTGEDIIDTDSYQVRMLVANVVPALLKCRIQGIDGKFKVYYDVTSRQSLTSFYEEQKMRIEDLKIIFGSFVQVMEELSEYLLNPCQLILEPEYIYMDAGKKNIQFCYMPGYQKELQKQLQKLLEYILPKIDHDDGQAVVLGYGIYRRALEESFHLEHIKEELYRVDEKKEETLEELTQVPSDDYIKDASVEKDIFEYEDKKIWKKGENNINYSKYAKNNSAECRIIYGKRNTEKKPEGLWTGGILKYAVVFIIAASVLTGTAIASTLGYIPGVKVEMILMVILVAMILEMFIWAISRRTGNVRRSDDREKNKRQKSEIEHEMILEKKKKNRGIFEKETEQKNSIPGKSADEDYGETVILSTGNVKGPASLVSREAGELATIYLNKDIVVVGKMETASDAVIDMPTVSRMHAKIRKRDNRYYLSDLNSKNGTTVNGKLLKTGEEYELKNEDEVDFAQARYIFLK